MTAASFKASIDAGDPNVNGVQLQDFAAQASIIGAQAVAIQVWQSEPPLHASEQASKPFVRRQVVTWVTSADAAPQLSTTQPKNCPSFCAPSWQFIVSAQVFEPLPTQVAAK